LIERNALVRISNKMFDDGNHGPFQEDENPYNDAQVFLHGSCDLFAIALHQKYGYAGLHLKTDQNEDAHYFCSIENEGKTLYIDVRGVTDNQHTIIDEFLAGVKSYSVIPYTFPHEDSLSAEEQYGLAFAKQILSDNPDIYDVACHE